MANRNRPKRDDEYWKQRDKLLDGESESKAGTILVIGLVAICACLLVNILIGNVYVTDNTMQYEEGLSIDYSGEEQRFEITFTNPAEDTTNMSATIYIMTENGEYKAFEKTTDNFEESIYYTPYLQNMEHRVEITLTKTNNDNYIYVYIAKPEFENNKWNNGERYINWFKDIFNI